MESIDAIQKFVKSSGFTENFTLEPIRAEASVRRYTRILFSNSFNFSDTRKKSLILCSTGSKIDQESDDFIQTTHLFAKNGVPVPEIFGIESENGWLLLSDGGERDLNSVFMEKVNSKEISAAKQLMEKAVEIMVSISNVPPSDLIASRAFDKEKLFQEMLFFEEKLNLVCNAIHRKSVFTSTVKSILLNICEQLGKSSDKVVSHRDFHSRNVLVKGSSQLTVIDYQDARMGLPWYDLGSILFDPYLLLSPELIQEGIETYLRISGVRFDEKSRTLFYLQSLQRMFKAMGSYLYLSYEKGMNDYGNSLLPALKNARYIMEMLGDNEYATSLTNFSRELEMIVPVYLQFLENRNR